MQPLLDYSLFRIGGTEVTLASLLTTLGLVVATLLVSRWVRVLVAHRLLARTPISLGLRYAIGRVLGYVVLVFGLLASLQPLGLNPTSFAVFSGAVGIGVGFGLQDIIKNFFAGLILLFERPISVGDSIKLGDVIGDVVEIHARATVVRTNDDILHIVPNSRFITEVVVNRSKLSHSVRYRIPVAVAMTSDPRKVEAALLEAAGRAPSVLREPPARVWFRAFGESALEFELLCWTSTLLHRQGAFRSELNFLIHETLAAKGIELPYPQRDVHIRSAEGLRGVVEKRGGEGGEGGNTR